MLDYVVVKMPKFPFDKFVYAARKLGTQMKATGEVMAIGQNFEEAILKACRGLEVGVKDLNLPSFAKEGDEKIRDRVHQCTDQRIFAIYQALKRGLLSVEEIHKITKIDEWFLWKLEKICKMEAQGVAGRQSSPAEGVAENAKGGCSEGETSPIEGVFATSAEARSFKRTSPSLIYQPTSFKMVDTCAGEFNAETPYFYSTAGGENEAELFLKENR